MLGKDDRKSLELRSKKTILPCLKTPSVNSTTSNSTPPPGAKRSTLGTKPLYRAAGPSSRKMVTTAGYVQLYFGVTPGTLAEP